MLPLSTSDKHNEDEELGELAKGTGGRGSAVAAFMDAILLIPPVGANKKGKTPKNARGHKAQRLAWGWACLLQGMQCNNNNYKNTKLMWQERGRRRRVLRGEHKSLKTNDKVAQDAALINLGAI